MTALESALLHIAAVLKSANIPYTVIGGMANAVWGEPRATLDIDISLWVSDGDIPAFLQKIAKDFQLLPENPQDFIGSTRVLPIQNHEGTRIDLIFGMLPFENHAIQRSKEIPIQNQGVRFCTPEDLILFKIVSERKKDLEDVRNIISRQKSRLDLAYLEPRIKELAAVLEKPGIRENWEKWKNS